VTAPDTVFFLSDYGLRDTFVGVVHATLRRLAPHAAVIDLTHEIAPFDVRGGAMALAQAVPHLGPGVVLAVVDPGVGGGRRCVAVRTGHDDDRPRWLVGPDNGLLVPALEALGGLDTATVWQLAPRPHDRGGDPSVTFDGRDVLAPAAGAICRGEADLGAPVDPAGLVKVAAPVVEHDNGGGRVTVRAEVTALDRFGNVQLAARRADLPAQIPAPDDVRTLRVSVAVMARFAHPERDDAGVAARWVSTFGDLERGELGLLVDSNGCLALVMAEASAAAALCIAAGDLVALTI
jgi:S-adenosylmethionine hydrolase